MNHLKHGLAAALALLSLGLAHAVTIPWEQGMSEYDWTLSNFEYAKLHGGSGTIATSSRKSYEITLDGSTEMLGELPTNATLKLDTVQVAIDDHQYQKTIRPILLILQAGNIIAHSSSSKTSTAQQTIYTSETGKRSAYTWVFSFDDEVVLDPSNPFELIFASSYNESTGVFTDYDAWATGVDGYIIGGVYVRREADFDYVPYLELSGTYTPRAVPEPTALALLALGGVTVLLRRPKP